MNSAKLRPWETVSKETILDHGKFLKVENHVIKLPDGQIISDWPWVIAQNAVIVLAVTDDERFLCFRQTKYAIEGTSLAPVGGMLQPGEVPLEAAKRELREEMGYDATDWVSLGSYVLEPNRGVGTAHLFLALNAKKANGQPESDDLEDQEFIALSQYEIERALRAGEFKALSWSAAVAMSLNYLYMSEHK